MIPIPWFRHPLLLTFIAGVLCWVFLRMMIPILGRQLLDEPNARSSHRQPTPRGGGLAFVLISTVLSPLAGSGWTSFLPLLCTPLAFIGILDDRYDIHAGIRYGMQLVTGLMLIIVAAMRLPHWSLPFILIAITAIINFFNFMDGLDGLVALCSLCLLLTAASMGVLTADIEQQNASAFQALWPLIGSLAGFLVWNWSPAKIFMGDVGSTFLGAIFSGVVLQQSTSFRALEFLLVAFPMLADAAVCVLRRLLARQPIFSAHRLHLFQRLHQAGWSHGNVALLYGLATLALGVIFLWGNIYCLLIMLVVELAAGIWLDQHVAVKFSLTAR